MKFKKLEVSGFKSFADKLEVKFGAGITAIVGPNGCGKSNVADSIRWVLGEQSAKLLRGSSMQDVIFNGTEKRRSLSYCEVSLYFDNTTRIFPIEYDEVVITRKLYRSGESEYQLNKSQCRLKDIVDLLRDSGLGREGYSIIGQGRIDELLSAKPDDRRAIFEEAAGISKFKARKTDSERKLARTRDNLMRINDILAEMNRQIEPLSRQSDNAKKWLEYRDKLKHFEINTYLYQSDTASQAKKVINDRLTAILEETEVKNNDCENASSRYNFSMESLNKIDKTIGDAREELLILTVGLEKQMGEVKLYNEKLGNMTEQNARLTSENATLNNQFVQVMAMIEIGENDRLAASQRLEKLRAESDVVSDRYLAIIDSLTSGEDEVEAGHKAIMDAMDRLTDIKSNMSRLLAERDSLGSRSLEIEREIAASNDGIKQLRVRSEQKEREIGVIQTQRDKAAAKLSEFTAEYNDCVANIAAYNKELDASSARFYQVRSRHKLLTDMQIEYEGFAYSVKKLMQDARTRRELSDKIEGVIAQIINVPEKFETAIEMALGGAVQNIVTPREEDAKFLIEYLKRTRYGRVTFLPMTAIKPRYLEREFARFMGANGVFGAACDLVNYDKKFDNIIKGLLGKTVIVENMDIAIDLARKTNYSFKIVTLEGDIINPQGSITGGSKKTDIGNLFGHERELKELAEELETLTTRMSELNSSKEASGERAEKLLAEIKNMREKIHGFELQMAAMRENFSEVFVRVETAESELNGKNETLQNITKRIATINKDINSVGELENIIVSAKETASSASTSKQSEFDGLKKQRDIYHEKLTNIKMEIAKIENDIEVLDKDISRYQNSTMEASSKIEVNNVAIASNKRVLSAIDEQIKDIESRSKENNSERVAYLRKELDKLTGSKTKLQEDITEFDNKRLDLLNQLQRLNESKNREEVQLIKVDTDIEQLEERIREEYELEYQTCLPYRQEDYDIKIGVVETNKLKKQMSNLGSVNINAIEDYTLLYDRFHEMDIQREDLENAENDLNKIIEELSAEMVGRFNEQFAKIRSNFVKIFKELFNGGNADLILCESENPLEAGIEIYAQPPEKKLQSISLLSGGERALTAIAILFAILRLKPMPFCVLDEIEAALDDANAGRFAKYLRRFSEETQFIVITHRKPTMELADSLYGVTMQEKGISKIVSVKLSEAVAVALPESKESIS